MTLSRGSAMLMCRYRQDTNIWGDRHQYYGKIIVNNFELLKGVAQVAFISFPHFKVDPQYLISMDLVIASDSQGCDDPIV